jgi:hypothetical protein
MPPILFKLKVTGGARGSGTFYPAPVPTKTPGTKPFVSFVPKISVRPILFKLAFTGLGRNAGRVMPWIPLGPRPLPATRLSISGITKDSTGTPLGNCAVALYRTVDDLFLERVTSDGSGNYSFSSVGLGEAYYVVAYKAGAPDVAGTTVNTLVGA